MKPHNIMLISLLFISSACGGRGQISGVGTQDDDDVGDDDVCDDDCGDDDSVSDSFAFFWSTMFQCDDGRHHTTASIFVPEGVEADCESLFNWDRINGLIVDVYKSPDDIWPGVYTNPTDGGVQLCDRPENERWMRATFWEQPGDVHEPASHGGDSVEIIEYGDLLLEADFSVFGYPEPCVAENCGQY